MIAINFVWPIVVLIIPVIARTLMMNFMVNIIFDPKFRGHKKYSS